MTDKTNLFKEGTFCQDLSGFENLTGLNESVSTDASTPSNDVNLSAIDTNAPSVDASIQPVVRKDLIRLEKELWCKLCNP